MTLPAWLLVAAACGGAALILAAGWWFLRPRDPVLQALHRGKPQLAARRARTAPPARDAQQALVRCIAFTRAGFLEEAEQQLAAFPLPAADRLFVLATLRVKQGRAAEARMMLEECIAINPAYEAEARMNVDLLRLNSPEAEPWPREGYT